jgi:cytochrome c6
MHKFFCILTFTAIWVANCTSAADDIERRAAEAQQKGSAGGAPVALDGGAIFRRNCTTCHGADGKLGMNGAKDLTQSTMDADSRVAIITNGKNLMTPFKALLKPEEIAAVAAYTMTLK